MHAFMRLIYRSMVDCHITFARQNNVAGCKFSTKMDSELQGHEVTGMCLFDFACRNSHEGGPDLMGWGWVDPYVKIAFFKAL